MLRLAAGVMTQNRCAAQVSRLARPSSRPAACGLVRCLPLLVPRSLGRIGLGRWITFYNHQRPHAAHGGQPPAVVYFTATQTDQQVQAVA